MGEIIRVSIGEANVGKAGEKLFTVVGSCVAVMLYDKVEKIGGMIHIMLGYSKGNQDNICKYADTGIPFLINMMIKKGAGRHRLMGAKISGGAELLMKSDTHNVSKGNVEAVKKILTEQQIKIIKSDCGASHGRRITFDIDSGKVTIESHNGLTKVL